uniref:Uncharacterized protein n=1 Tax=Zooxanthella nutricula TaxID=1333877 RepID=A0A7S2VFV0_9DINO
MSGLAGKVRRAAESEEFDLANYDQARCDELAKGAFSEPLPIGEMVRLSFVVGGGKLVRQKYTDDLPKVFMGSLANIGYVNDDSAAVEAGSGGKFKYQHDTGKNLKFVHVFPHIAGASQATAAQDGGDAEDEEEEQPRTPEEILVQCDADDFKELVEDQLPTYGQKKRLLDLLKARVASLEAIEAKMARLEQLSAEEQALFDGVGVEEVKEKAKVVSAELQGMAERGQLTAAEKAAVQEQLEARLAAAEAELQKAEAEGKAKRAQQLTQQLEAIRKTRAAVKDCTPVALPTLRHSAEIAKLHGKLLDIARLEKDKKGNYTVAELTRLGEKPEIEEAIEILSQRSRGWLEADDVFQERLQACLRKASSGAAKKPGASSGGYAGGKTTAGASSGWSTASGGARAAKGKASAPSTRNAFSALS